MTTGTELSIIDVISETLRYVKSAALDEINKTQLSNICEDDIHWVLTVPAIWTDMGKVITY